MPEFALYCVPASGGVAVAPCATVNGTAYEPAMIATAAPYDYANSVELFGWALSGVLICWIIGLTVGSMMRVIRSA